MQEPKHGVYFCFCYDANADTLVQPPSRAGGVGFGFGTDLVWTWTWTGPGPGPSLNGESGI